MTTDTLPLRVRTRRDLETLLARATNYEELRPASRVRPVFKLDRVRDLLASVGDPHLGPRTVHVAGSKGKGSVARMVEQILRMAGRGPVGLFTSPHLEDLAERVAVDDRPARESDLVRAADALLPHVRRVHGTPRAVTFFELLTAMACSIFRDRGCTDVILETGLGGRLDATNVCRPALTLVTSIELEHTEVLGDTLDAIAAEKAGILKEGVAAGTSAEGVALEVLTRRAAEVGAPLVAVGREIGVAEVATGPGPLTRARVRLPAADGGSTLSLRMPISGAHHGANAALAAWAGRRLGVSGDGIVRAFADLRLPGILEPLGGDPLVVIDGAHTPASAASTRAAVDACWPGRRVVVLIALLEGKDAEGIGEALLDGVAGVVTTRLPTPRAVPPEVLADRLGGHAEPDLARALDLARARAGPGGLVLATGSVRLAGAVRGTVTGEKRRIPGR